MANQRHLEIVKQGIEVWGDWRQKHFYIIPDLSGANLSGAYLSGANLSGANLSGANLRWANLTMANLSKANLNDANLFCANLSGANLSSAKLIKANLTGTALATFSSDHIPANLNGANLSETVFTPKGKPIGSGSFLDLSACLGLDAAKFTSTTFLQDYLINAFEYAHQPDSHEAKNWPRFFDVVIQRIRYLRTLYSDDHPPKQLVEIVGVITSELIEYLKKHHKALYEIKPRQFEELIAEILASYGWQVQLTPETRDGGYDIYAINKGDSSGLLNSWIIECKKYSAENKVGLDIVRSLYGLRTEMKVGGALLATTSCFSKDAQDYKASRYDLKLRDYEGVLEWVNEYRPNPNGRLYIKDNKLIVPNEQ